MVTTGLYLLVWLATAQIPVKIFIAIPAVSVLDQDVVPTCLKIFLS